MNARITLSVAAILLACSCEALQMPDIAGMLKFWDTPRQPEPEPAATESHREKRRIHSSGDTSPYPHIIETTQLPVNKDGSLAEHKMPVLGSGIIASSVYSNKLYVNGLYNGKGANTHRAEVPAIVMTRIDLGELHEKLAQRSFKFDASEGIFTETVISTIGDFVHRTYIHQKYSRLLITDIRATKKEYGGLVHLRYTDFNFTTDIRFEAPQPYEGEYKATGRTLEAERSASVSSVHCFFFNQVKTIQLKAEKTRSVIMIMSVDIREDLAKQDFDEANRIIQGENGLDRLLEEHREAWRKTWSRGKIEVKGDTQLAKTTIFSQYYLLSSMPSVATKNKPEHNAIYYGIARNSLARGGLGRDSHGHIFWDNEMYIMPALLLFHPDVAKKLLRIRSATSSMAREEADQHGHQGYQFPWEIAVSGHDVTPASRAFLRRSAVHVSGAVGWSIRQYFSATRDKAYLNDQDFNGCDMTKEIARFYAKMAVYNPSIGRYELRNVTGPDEWHPQVNNNAYITVLASLAIHWARYFACMCDRDETAEVPDEWLAVAEFLELPFDNDRRVHYQFSDFEKLSIKDQMNKQADTIMLTYPLNWNMSRDIMHNDMDMYESLMSDNTPAMTWSFFTVGWKWAEEPSKMNSYFYKSYEDYISEPYRVWSEYGEGTVPFEDNTFNFLPGAAGFLQSLIYGFAGIRIRPEFLEFHSPTPPPGCSSMIFTSFNYVETEMNIEIWEDRVVIEVTEVGSYPLKLKRNQTWVEEEKLTVGARVTIDNPKEGFYLFSSEGNTCDHPRDYIYMPWGYNDFLSSALPLRSSKLVCVFLLALVTTTINVILSDP